MIGRPKSNEEVLTVGLTITITKTEKKYLDELLEISGDSMNQFFRDMLSEKILVLRKIMEKDDLE